MKRKNQLIIDAFCMLFFLIVPLLGQSSLSAATCCMEGLSSAADAEKKKLTNFHQNAQGENYSSHKLKTFAVPNGYPQEGEPLFNISADGQYTGVYTDINAWNALVSFGYFDVQTGEEVEVTITTAKPFTTYQILPESAQIRSKQEGQTIRFKLQEVNQQLSFVFDEDYQGSTLHLFVNKLETNIPQESNENLIYYGPGYHQLEEPLIIPTGKDLFIDGGAVVEGHVKLPDNIGSRVYGHGMLMCTSPGDLVLSASYARKISFEGIIVCSHRNPGWTVGLHACSDVTIDQVKVVSTRYASTDGFDIVNSNNIKMRNTFIRSCDDAIAIKGLIEGNPADCPPNEYMWFSNIQLWNDCNNAICLGAETRAKHYQHIYFKDIEVLSSYDDRDHHEALDERSVMSIVCLEGTYFCDILWENVRVNRCERLICITFKDSFWFGTILGDQSTPGGVENISYKNVSVKTTSGSRIANEILLNGWHQAGTPTKYIRNITFDNVLVEGKLVNSLNTIKTNNTAEQKPVSGIVFK